MMTKKPTLEPETPASSITKQPGQTPPWVLATNSHVGVLLASEGVVRSPRCRRERQGLHTHRQVVALLVQHSGGGQVHHLQDGKSGTYFLLNNFSTLDSHSGRGEKCKLN